MDFGLENNSDFFKGPERDSAKPARRAVADSSFFRHARFDAVEFHRGFRRLK